MNNLFDRFIQFSNTFYSMLDIKSKVKDDRKSPQIPPSVVFLSLLALMLLIFTCWNLLLLFNQEGTRSGYEEVKWTLDFLSSLLLLSFYVNYKSVDYKSVDYQTLS